ncbi:phage tail terminator-like protein [Rhodovibrionaceae bacterium A322]
MTLTFDAALSAFRQHLTDQWSATPIAWPNRPFDPAFPGGGFPAGGPFLQWDLCSGDSRYLTLGPAGNRLRRQEGELVFYLLIPPGAGDVLHLADDLVALVSGRNFAGLQCQAARIADQSGPDNQRSGWWQRQISLPFVFFDRG